jgi:hypothetical protein
MSNQNQFGTQLPTTEIYDVSQELKESDYSNASIGELLVRLYQNTNSIIGALNAKESGYYDTQQVVSGQLFFPNSSAATPQELNWNYRPGIRKLIFYTTALPNTGTVPIPHLIDFTNSPNFTFTHIYGCTNNPTTHEGLPLPYAHPTAANAIALSADATKVYITTGSDRTGWTITYIVLEYLMF